MSLVFNILKSKVREDLIKNAICLSSSKRKEKDRVFTVLSKNNGVDWIVAKSCMSLSKLYVPLASTSDLFTLKSIGIKEMILKDIQIKIKRDYISNDYLKYLYFSQLSSFFFKYAKYDKEHSFEIVSDFSTSLKNIETEDEIKMLYAWSIEKYLSYLLYKDEYKKCPICDRVYTEGESIGYSSVISSACCSDCADYKNIISNKTRIILDNLQHTDINNLKDLANTENKAQNIIKYIQFRLRLINYEQLYKK